MRVLGIETSCDETAVALVEDGRTIRSNLLASQAHLHEKFGGVVPEVASRAHVENINPLITQALVNPDQWRSAAWHDTLPGTEQLTKRSRCCTR